MSFETHAVAETVHIHVPQNNQFFLLLPSKKQGIGYADALDIALTNSPGCKNYRYAETNDLMYRRLLATSYL